jgi:ribosomal protein S18 acetylase RimI-like enzyme
MTMLAVSEQLLQENAAPLFQLRNSTRTGRMTVYNNNALQKDSFSFTEARHVVGRSFAGSKTSPTEQLCAWACFRPMGLMEDLSNKEEEAQRIELSKFFMSFPLQETLDRRGTIFGIQEEDGKLQSVVAFIEYDEAHSQVQGKLGKFLILMKAIIFATKDLGWSNFLFSRNFNRVVMPRVDLFEIELESKHETFGPKQGTHWYIKAVATDPDAQGKGYGSIMMRTLGAAADEHQVESYLETTGDKNRSFYETFGYKVVGHLALEAETPDGKSVERLENGYIMKRLPNK